MLYDTIIPTKYMRNVPISLKKDYNQNLILETHYNECNTFRRGGTILGWVLT